MEDSPTFVLSPPSGSVILFGGQVTHAGQQVFSGQRCVFVASFSPDLEVASRVQTPAVGKVAILKQRMAEYEKRAKRMATHNARMEDLGSST